MSELSAELDSILLRKAYISDFSVFLSNMIEMLVDAKSFSYRFSYYMASCNLLNF